jgi:hypothetical protein
MVELCAEFESSMVEEESSDMVEDEKESDGSDEDNWKALEVGWE